MATAMIRKGDKVKVKGLAGEALVLFRNGDRLQIHYGNGRRPQWERECDCVLVPAASDPFPWVASLCRCRVCGAEFASVYPEGTDDDALECPNCGSQSAEPQ